MTVVTADRNVEHDRLLVERSQAGDATAFGDLYARYHGRLVRHCTRRLGSSAIAEDVTQEAFIRAWRAIDRFEVHRSFYPWLQVIASNACTDVLRRHRPTAPLTELVGAAESDDGPGVEEQVTMAFDAALATGAMEQLSVRHRRVLHLREQLDWSVQEIAEHEGLEANAVDTLLWRARASLRRRFRALSEGAAAMIATGGVRAVSVRNRLLHTIHHVDGRWGTTLRVRAAVAAAVVVGVGAAAAPLTWSPANPPRPTSDIPAAPSGATVPRDGARPPVPAGHDGSPVVTPGQGVPPLSASSTGHSVVPAGSGTGGSVQASTIQASGGRPAATVGGASDAASPGSGVIQPITGVVSGIAGTVDGTVHGAIGGVQTVTGGTVAIAPIVPTLPPILPPTAGTSSGITGTGVVGASAGLLGLGTH